MQFGLFLKKELELVFMPGGAVLKLPVSSPAV